MSTRDIVLIALFAALTAALGLFPPIFVVAVPITAQSLGVMLAGSVLGAKRGGLAILLFMVLVAIGVPVLAGGRGGFGMFASPSGGFLLSWPIAAFAIGYMTERLWGQLNIFSAAVINIVGGIILIYACGIPWLAATTELSLFKALLVSANYVPGDVIKVAAAAVVAVAVKRAYPIIRPAVAAR